MRLISKPSSFEPVYRVWRFNCSISSIQSKQSLCETYRQNREQLTEGLYFQEHSDNAHTLTAKKIPDSFSIRATQICMVPMYLSDVALYISDNILLKRKDEMLTCSHQKWLQALYSRISIFVKENPSRQQA